MDTIIFNSFKLWGKKTCKRSTEQSGYDQTDNKMKKKQQRQNKVKKKKKRKSLKE